MDQNECHQILQFSKRFENMTWKEAKECWYASIDNWFEAQIRAGVNPVGTQKANPGTAAELKEKNMGKAQEVRARALTTVNHDDFSAKPAPKTVKTD